MDYNSIRRNTRKIKIGNIYIGGDSPIAIQSMTNTDTHDKEATLRQILSLESRGCDIVRITVPDTEAVSTIPYLKNNGAPTSNQILKPHITCLLSQRYASYTKRTTQTDFLLRCRHS